MKKDFLTPHNRKNFHELLIQLERYGWLVNSYKFEIGSRTYNIKAGEVINNEERFPKTS